MTNLDNILQTVLIIKHFESSIKNNEFLGECLSIMQVQSIHMISWCQTRTGYFFKVCSTCDILHAVYNVMATASFYLIYTFWKWLAILSHFSVESCCIYLTTQIYGINSLKPSCPCSWKHWWLVMSFWIVCTLMRMGIWIALWKPGARSRDNTSTDTINKVNFESVSKLFEASEMIYQMLSKEYWKLSKITLEINVMKMHFITILLPLKLVLTNWEALSADFAVSMYVLLRNLHPLIMTRKRI